MKKKWSLLILSLVLLIMSWENSLEAKGLIPGDSIRIRILANSDSIADQWIKKQVRDAIIAESKTWVEQLTAEEINSARHIIEDQLPEFQRITEQTLEKFGFTYGAQVELGYVDFPSKLYGNKVYPENQYEAVRITLGAGAGENWWCVLFPPLCFIDGMTVNETYPQAAVNKNANKTEVKDKDQNNTNEISKKTADQGKTKQNEAKVKPAFFLVELWNSWF